MVRHKLIATTASIALAALASVSTQAFADRYAVKFKATLSGFEEVPSVSTDAAGKFSAELRKDLADIAYELSYTGLGDDVRFAHIHFAQRGVNGGVIVWLCDNTGNGPEETQTCPQEEGTVEGVITADDVVGPGDQGIDPGEFDELLAAMIAGSTYVNLHTDRFPGGELRGQIKRGRRRHY